MSMKISAETLTILKNLAVFNQHLVVKAGKKLQSVNENETILISVDVPEEFPVDFALHDLSGFLKIVGLFEDPCFDFEENSVIISDDTAQQEYFFSDPTDLIYNHNELDLPDPDVTVELPANTLAKVLKAAGANGVEDIAVVGKSNGVFLQAKDKENPKRTFSVELSGESKGDFTVYLKHSKKGNKLSILPFNYNLEISQHGVVQFKAEVEDVNICYTYAIETDSEFDL